MKETAACDQFDVDDYARRSPEYSEGIAAFDAGLSNESNPYPIHSSQGDKRTRWFVGWYDRKHEPIMRK